MDGVRSVYISYAPDLSVPGATHSIQQLVDRAVANGVTRLVLLSGRGEAEAQACEKIVQASGVEWTIVRSSWFMQNFSEGEFLQMVLVGTIALPAADVPEPFIDINDLADVAVAALTETGHAYEIYEVTGPRLLTFSELANEISAAARRDVSFANIPAEAFAQGIRTRHCRIRYSRKHRVVTELLLAIVSIATWTSSHSPYLLGGAVSYIGGTWLVTAFGNVPLNDKLAAVDSGNVDTTEVWDHYLDRWTTLNSRRTGAALVAAVLFSN